jgi:hypothetical protein
MPWHSQPALPYVNVDSLRLSVKYPQLALFSERAQSLVASGGGVEFTACANIVSYTTSARELVTTSSGNQGTCPPSMMDLIFVRVADSLRVTWRGATFMFVKLP